MHIARPSLLELTIVTIVVFSAISMSSGAMAQTYLTGAEKSIQDVVKVSQEKGVDPRVDYSSLTQYGPWDDRNYAVTLEDLSLLPAKDQYLSNVPVFFKTELRKEQPELGDFYPRSALQAFHIRHGGLVVNGLLYKNGVSEKFVQPPQHRRPSS
ncbi:MAG: hypothetical protein AB8B57_10215 [Congregibacter sp.]